MKKERKAPTTKSTISSSSSSSDSEKEVKPAATTKSKSSKQERNSKSSSRKSNNTTEQDISVRLRNADVFAKYRNKNPHLVIENRKTSTNFPLTELSDDDEVWLFEMPSAVDVTELVGKTIKVGSKSSLIKTNFAEIECVSNKFNEAKVISLVCQQNNSQLSVKNVRPIGRVMLRTKIDDSIDVPIDLTETSANKKVPFPRNLKVRHPLHGANFEHCITLDEIIKNKLAKAHIASMEKSKPRIKQEYSDSVEMDVDVVQQTTPKKSKKRKLEREEDTVVAVHKKAKKDIKAEDVNDDDLAWLKKI